MSKLFNIINRLSGNGSAFAVSANRAGHERRHSRENIEMEHRKQVAPEYPARLHSFGFLGAIGGLLQCATLPRANTIQHVAGRLKFTKKRDNSCRILPQNSINTSENCPTWQTINPIKDFYMKKTRLFSFVLCFVITLLSGLASAQAQAQPSVGSEEALKNLVGVWEGSYRAGQGETGLTLTVYEEGGIYKATFDFRGRNNATSGKYYMDVSYNESTRRYLLRGREWIVRPVGYSFVNLEGTLTENIFSGPTYNFRVVKLDPAEIARREAEIARREAERVATIARQEAERVAAIARRETEQKAEAAKREAEWEAEIAKQATKIADAALNATTVQGNNLADKLAWLQAFIQSNGNYIVEVNNDETVNAPLLLEYSGKSDIIIFFKGKEANRAINGKTTVGSGITLVLGSNITLNGGVVVNSGGTLIMNDDSTVTGSRNSGVVVNGGTFTMNGGAISGNTATTNGGGVSVNGGTFTMNDGTISGNTGGHGGGLVITGGPGNIFLGVGVSVAGGTFHMRGGTISDNSGGGVGITGSPSAMGFRSEGSVGTFNMSGGTITGNGGSGVRVQSHSNLGAILRGAFNMNGGTISDNRGSGVIMHVGTYTGVEDATFSMNKGTISNNRGSGVSGAGTFTMNDGTISGNIASIGGGVSGVTFTMNGGTISANTANGNGGGVAVGTFIMRGGIISGNTATQNGGGVFVGNGAFIKTGGTISGYSSDQNKGNLVKDGSDTVLNFRGHAAYAGSTSRVIKIKETSAESEDNLSYNGNTNPATFSGAWDN